MKMEFISSKTVKTRKKHDCLTCGREFPGGSIMRTETNINDDGIFHVYICVTCQKLIGIIPELTDADGFYWELCTHYYITGNYEEPYPAPEKLLAMLSGT